MLEIEAQERAWRSFSTGLPCDGTVRLIHIMSAVSLHTGVSADDIKSKRKLGPIIYARHLYCYLARFLTQNSLSQIGKSIGFRDHTTVINSVSRIDDWLKKDKPGLREDIEDLKRIVVQFSGGDT